MSTEHKTLHEALCAVQSEVGTLPKDATNPHFQSKFTPLDTIVEHVGPVLAKHGLTWSVFPCYAQNGEPALRYKLTHAASGDSESEVMPLLVQKADPQGLGSAMTYARRYSISAVLNLVSDEDDDGNGASRRSAEPEKPFGIAYDYATVGPATAAACVTLAGDKDRGIALFKTIAKDCGGYMPQAASLALIHAATPPSNEIEAPEIT